MKQILFSVYKSFTLCWVALLVNLTTPGFAQNAPTAGTYLLQNVSTGLYMTAEEADQSDILNVFQKAKIGDSYQRFEIEVTGKGLRFSSSVTSGTKYLSVVDGTAATRNKSGTQLMLAEDSTIATITATTATLWTVKNTGTGALDAFTIQSNDPSSKNFIGVNSTTDNKVVQLASTVSDKRVQWRFVRVLPVGQYYIQNISTGLYLTSAGTANNSKVQQGALSKVPSQTFEVAELEGSGYVLSPISTKGKEWISVNQGTTTTSNPAGTALFTYQGITHGNPTDNQFWDIDAVSGLPSEDGQFTIRSNYASSNKLIGANSATDKQIVQLGSTASTALSRWRFVSLDEPIQYVIPGRYVLQNVGTGKVMDVYGARTANGTKVIQYNGIGEGRNEQFQVEEEGDNYRISPSHTYRSKWLSVQPKTATSNPDGTGLFINDKATDNTQTWDISYAGKSGIDEPYYTVKSTLSGKYLGVADSLKSDIIQRPLTKGNENQLWIFTEALVEEGALEEGRYIIQNAKTGKVLDMSGAQVTDGAAVIQYDLSGANNQVYEVMESGPNTYKMSPVHTGGQKFLSVYGGTDPSRNSNGKTLYQAGSNPALQNWEISLVDTGNPEDLVYNIRSTDPSSGKLIGIYSATDKRVVQWDADANDARFQWNFVFDDYVGTNAVAGVPQKNARKAVTTKDALEETVKLELSKSVVVSPNPVQGEFEVSLTGFAAEDEVRVQIVGLQGQSVYAHNAGSDRLLKLSTRALQMTPGLYILEASNGLRRQSVRLIVVP